MKGWALFAGPFLYGGTARPNNFVALCREQLFGRSGANHGCLRCRALLPSPAFRRCEGGLRRKENRVGLLIPIEGAHQNEMIAPAVTE